METVKEKVSRGTQVYVDKILGTARTPMQQPVEGLKRGKLENLEQELANFETWLNNMRSLKERQTIKCYNLAEIITSTNNETSRTRIWLAHISKKMGA